MVRMQFRRGSNSITRARVVDNTWSLAITRKSSAGNRGGSTFQACLFGVCTASPALVIACVPPRVNLFFLPTSRFFHLHLTAFASPRYRRDQLVEGCVTGPTFSIAG